jgi:hypothetical protein
MRALPTLALSLVYASTIAAFWFSASAAPANKDELSKGQSGSETVISTDTPTSEKEQHYNKNALRRLDFRIQGKSCAICLLGIQRRLKTLAGTIRVAVMLKKPYGASVIYDSSQVSEQTLLTTAKLNEPLIKLLDVNDAPIEKVPLVLIPPHVSMQSGSTSALLLAH